MTNIPGISESGRLDEYLDSIENLPPTPGLMIKLIALFRQPDRDVDEIVELMRHDPPVTAELLRRCNNSFFGNDKRVTDITESVFRLGFYEVYRISVALFGRKTMAAAKLTQDIGVEELWQHSALVAIAAGAIARDLGESEGSAFTAGLLHDMGKIVLASAEGSKYTEVLQEHGHFGAALDAVEKTLFGFGHGEIGARLLIRWGVPAQVGVPVMCHHQLNWSGPFERLAAIVNLANLMAHCLQETDTDKPCEPPEAFHAMELLGLERENMQRLELLVRSDTERLGALLATGVPATAA